MTAALALFGTWKPLAASFVRWCASSPAVRPASSDRRDQYWMDAQPSRPLASGDLADRGVHLARLLICQALKLRAALQAQTGGVVLLLASGRPFEILGAIVDLFAIDVVDRVFWRGAWTDKRFGDKGMDRRPFLGSGATAQANSWVAALEHRLEDSLRVLAYMFTGFRMDASSAAPQRIWRNSPDTSQVRHFIHRFPACDWSPLLISHAVSVQHLGR